MGALRSRLDFRALGSILVCGLLVAVGALRMLSYSTTGALARELRGSALGFLAYRPEVPWSVRFFKLLATPVVVAGIYFVFRALNRGHRVRTPGYAAPDRTIDFSSPRLRLVLTAVATLHWIPLEYMKFTRADFYPGSPLEDPALNAVVLLASATIAFFGMRRLSFAPWIRRG